ncbi:MAG: ABC transporter permease [Candidatus Diapherotrites archaeon]|nr:ABC transporter permease [Candidatus Diapherotrites archaeon]
MKIFNIAWKEVKLIASQKTAIALILLYPLITIFALAFALSGGQIGPFFGQQDSQYATILYYIPSEEVGIEYGFLENVGGNKNIKLHKVNSPEKIVEEIRKGNASVGIVFERTGEESEAIKIRLLSDNSAIFSSNIVAAYAQSALDSYSYKKSVELLDDIWVNLNRIKDSLGEEVSKIDAAYSGIEDAKTKVLDLNHSLQEIDINRIASKADEFDYYYSDSVNKIAQANIEAGEAQIKIDAYKKKLISSRTELEGYSAQLKGIKTQITNVRVSSPQLIADELIKIENSLDSEIQKIDTTITDINSALIDLDDAKQKLDDAKTELHSAAELLAGAKESVAELRETLKTFEEIIENISNLIAESLEAQKTVKQSLDNTKELILDIQAKITELTGAKPSTIVKPIQIEEEKLFLQGENFQKIENLAIMTPPSIALVLLLTCILISGISVIVERKEGAALRARLSPTRKTTWVFGKIMGQLVFALIEIAIILGIVIALGVPIIGSPIELLLVILITAFVFISIGLATTNFSNNQSNITLGALLIIVPFIFLSGIIFPLELMSQPVKTIASFSPLTLANNLLTSTMIKGAALTQLLPQTAILLGIGIALILIVLLKKEF